MEHLGYGNQLRKPWCYPMLQSQSIPNITKLFAGDVHHKVVPPSDVSWFINSMDFSYYIVSLTYHWQFAKLTIVTITYIMVYVP